MTYPSSAAVARTFTARHQLDSVSYGGTAVVSAFSYDDGMRRTGTAFHNGRSEARTFTPRLDNLPVSIVTDGSTTNFGYSWDANKRKTAESDGVITPASQTFGYDNEDRLTSFARTSGDTQSWTLSHVGDWSQFTLNGTTQTRTHNAVHELTAIDATSLTYDTKGNLGLNANGQTYAWDFENRLQSAIGGGTQGGSYTYDALGRRVTKNIDGANTIFVSDGMQEIAEYEQTSLLSTVDIGSVRLHRFVVGQQRRLQPGRFGHGYRLRTLRVRLENSARETCLLLIRSIPLKIFRTRRVHSH